MAAQTELEVLLVQAQDALEARDMRKAQDLVQRVLKKDATSRDGLMLQAVLHATHNRPEQAVAVLDEAIRHHSDDLALLTSKASFILDLYDDAEGALPLLEQVTSMLEEDGELDEPDADPELQAMAEEAWLLLSECRAMLQDLPGARIAAERAVKLAPLDPAAHLALATAQLDSNALDDAVKSTQEALKVDPGLPDAHWMLGRLHWLRGQEQQALTEFATARRAAPDRFGEPVRADAARILSLLKQGLADLPPSVRTAVEKVKVTVEDVPSAARLKAREPTPSVGTLGMYEGKAVELGPDDNPWDHLPRGVVLFRRNLELAAQDEGELKELCVVTVVHEVAQSLGMDLEMLDRVMPQ